MVEVTLTPRAKADLDEIWLHAAESNLAAADRLLDRIAARCRALADHPLIGPRRPGLAADLRMLVVDSHVVLYRTAPGNVDIVRVLHGSRDLRRLIDDR